MRVEAHNKHGNPVAFDATQLVIYDGFGNPIAFAVDISKTAGRSVIVVETLEEGSEVRFNAALRNFGLHNTVVCKNLKLDQDD